MNIFSKQLYPQSFPGIRDERWVTNTSPPWQTFLAAFGLLALELAVIRWTTGQIRIFAYFNNLVLIGAFLGSGIGMGLGRRFGGLVHCVIPMLLLLSIPLAFSKHIGPENFGLIHMHFPDSAVFLWSGMPVFTKMAFAANILVFLAVFALIALVFVCCGAVLGALFMRQRPLQAYAWNLTGALAGIATFTIANFLNASPPVWLLLGGLPFFLLSRTVPSFFAMVVVVVFGYFSIDGAIYSPYNRIDVHKKETHVELDVNRGFHQQIYDFSDTFLNSANLSDEILRANAWIRIAYDLPFQVNNVRNRALIVGAGTGNDVQAALRNGYSSVYAVDIDSRLIELGRKLHPEKPYSSPSVRPIVNDARAFFDQYRGEPFDVISFGLLDSHAMFSSMSSLRLDNYVYTVEGIRAAWRHVAPRGHLSISFSVFAGQWIADRLYWTIVEATGKEPIVVYTKMNYGATFLVASDMALLNFAPMERFQRLAPQQSAAATTITTDDWPFLYIRPGLFPWGYVITLSMVIIVTLSALPWAFGRHEFKEKFDPSLFFLGAAFMLLETRGITSLSLVFGSTWIVNAAIFFGILLVALAANLAVERWKNTKLLNVRLWFCLLLVSLFALWAFDNAWLNQFPLLIRGLAGGIINVLPVAFAGVIFSILFSRAQSPDAALGSNLLGAVVGGCTEYLSMLFGLRSMVLLAAGFYGLAMLFVWRRNR